MYDPDRYRDKAWKERNPIGALIHRMRADGDLTDESLAALEKELAGELERAVAAAESAPVEPVEPVEELTRFVCSDRS